MKNEDIGGKMKKEENCIKTGKKSLKMDIFGL